MNLRDCLRRLTVKALSKKKRVASRNIETSQLRRAVDIIAVIPETAIEVAQQGTPSATVMFLEYSDVVIPLVSGSYPDKLALKDLGDAARMVYEYCKAEGLTVRVPRYFDHMRLNLPYRIVISWPKSKPRKRPVKKSQKPAAKKPAAKKPAAKKTSAKKTSAKKA